MRSSELVHLPLLNSSLKHKTSSDLNPRRYVFFFPWIVSFGVLFYLLRGEEIGSESSYKTKEIVDFPTAQSVAPIRFGSHLDSLLIQNVYRITDKQLWIPVLKDHDNNGYAKVFTENLTNARVQGFVPNIHLKNTDSKENFCTFGAVVYETSLPATESRETVRLAYSNNAQIKEFEVRDIRIRENSPPNLLTVCSAPLSYVSDWPILVYWIESWIQHGADQILIYYHTVTPEVKKLLSYYHNLKSVSIELIPWGEIPVEQNIRGNFFEDPNTRFRDSTLASVDCLMRTRNSQYTIHSNVNEILWTDEQKKLVEILNNSTDSKTASITIEWEDAVYKANYDAIQSIDDLDIRQFKISQVIGEKEEKKKAKTIFVSKKVNREILEKKKRNNEVRVPSTTALFLTLRGQTRANKYLRTIDFSNHQELCQKSWEVQKISKSLKDFLLSPNWLEIHTVTQTQLNKCEDFVYTWVDTDHLALGMCKSIRACESFLTYRDTFYRAKSSFLDLNNEFTPLT